MDVSILGLKEGDQFWLRSCYLDPSFLRDTMTTWLAQEAANFPTKSPERWVPHVKFVEVAIDGKYQVCTVWLDKNYCNPSLIHMKYVYI